MLYVKNHLCLTHGNLDGLIQIENRDKVESKYYSTIKITS